MVYKNKTAGLNVPTLCTELCLVYVPTVLYYYIFLQVVSFGCNKPRNKPRGKTRKICQFN